MSRIFRRKSRIVIAILCLMVVAVLSTVMIASESNGNAEFSPDAMLSINGIPIPEEEFRMFLQDEKAQTADYFYKKYGTEYDDTFWDATYGGESPIRFAKFAALGKLIQVKSEQQAAVEFGALKSADYKQIEQALSRQKSVYGVETMEPFQAYMIYHSKLVLEAKAKFKADTTISEEKLIRYYEANKEEKYTTSDEIEVLRYQFVHADSGKGLELATQLVQDIQAGADPEALARTYSPLELQVQTKRYGSRESKDENSSEREAMLKEVAYELRPDETSHVLDYGSQSYILVCVERTEGDTVAFQDVKFAIQDTLKEERFDQMVTEAAAKANVEMDDSAFDRLRMQ